MAPRAKLIDITTWLYNSRYKGVQNKPDAGNNTSSKEDVQAAEKLDQGLGDRQYWDANAKRDTTSDAWNEKGWSFRKKVVLMGPIYTFTFDKTRQLCRWYPNSVDHS